MAAILRNTLSEERVAEAAAPPAAGCEGTADSGTQNAASSIRAILFSGLRFKFLLRPDMFGSLGVAASPFVDGLRVGSAAVGLVSQAAPLTVGD